MVFCHKNMRDVAEKRYQEVLKGMNSDEFSPVRSCCDETFDEECERAKALLWSIKSQEQSLLSATTSAGATDIDLTESVFRLPEIKTAAERKLALATAASAIGESNSKPVGTVEKEASLTINTRLNGKRLRELTVNPQNPFHSVSENINIALLLPLLILYL